MTVVGPVTGKSYRFVAYGGGGQGRSKGPVVAFPVCRLSRPVKNGKRMIDWTLSSVGSSAARVSSLLAIKTGKVWIVRKPQDS